MNDLIPGLRAEAERVKIAASAELPGHRRQPEEKPAGQGLPAHQSPTHQFPAHQFPAHQFPPKAARATEDIGESSSGLAMPALEGKDAPATSPPFESRRADEEDRDRARRTYRGRTVAMLRRYLRYSIEAGRLPSLLGSEFFRAKVTAYTVVTFEDRVIFVHDMETCLDRLDDFSRQIIARHILQEHDQAATGRLLGCTERTVRTYVPVVLDLFAEILLEVGLMERLDSNGKNSCQGGENDQIVASDCEDGKYKV
jgi:hypothetical protein